MPLAQPWPIASIFAACANVAPRALLPYLGANAVVCDAGDTINGPEAITQWLTRSQHNAPYRAVPLG